jgi:hypothetical protein
MFSSEEEPDDANPIKGVGEKHGLDFFLPEIRV